MTYPYIAKSGTLKKFIEKIPSVGIPDKVNQNYLYTLGFKSTNDRPIISVLRFIKFLDENGAPTDFYKNYRDTSKSSLVLENSLKESYSELFKLYPNADKQDNDSLTNFFRTSSGLGEKAVKTMAETFKALCSLAEFGSTQKLHLKTSHQEGYMDAEQHPEISGHTIIFALSKDRNAKIHLPDDITPEEIERLKILLDALK